MRSQRTAGPSRAGAVIASTLALAIIVASVTTGCALFDKKVEVLYIGDSIMVQSGQFAEQYLVQEPGIPSAKTHVEATNGTGLLTPKLYDWQAKARDLIDTYQPKIVVILFIGNYTDTDLWTGPDGKPVPDDYGDAFGAAWSAEAVKLNTTMASKGAQVDWVLPPPLAGPEGQRRQQRMTSIYTDLQKQVPSITLIDAVKSLGGPNGEWVWRRPGVDGGEVTVRQSDSVHLTDDGARLLAKQMAEVVAPQLTAARSKTS